MTRNNALIALIITCFLFLSCSEDPDVLIKNGDYESAIICLKKELSKDYKNTLLRNKITNLYFTNAQKNILENDLEEAERNIERGVIYSDETNPKIAENYADILVQLGSGLIESGNRKGSVDLKKKYENGVKLLKKAVQLSENNIKALEILNTINEQESRSYHEAALENYNLWLGDKINTSYLIESYKQLQLSTEILKLQDSDNFKNRLLETFLSINIKSYDFDIKLMKIYFNSENGYVAIKIRFYNNSSREIEVTPTNFTLYDIENNLYKFDNTAAKKGNYKGLFKKDRISAERFATGMLVFDTDFKRDPTFSRIEWMNDAENKYIKYFPAISITEIVLE